MPQPRFVRRPATFDKASQDADPLSHKLPARERISKAVMAPGWPTDQVNGSHPGGGLSQ